METLPNAIKALGEEFGPSGIVILQILGWISFGIIYIGLQYAGVDPAEFCRTNKLTVFTWVFEKGGNVLLAYLLNRALGPVRWQVAKAVLPGSHKAINRLVQPIAGVLGFKTPDEKEEKESKKSK
ncbi:hypothetical protein HDU79_009302 [Rhizoclosmatium sp. JEL0117]|nr:hypothetical protein HDU79_009302 [Rhizoclosmatium sp. JEL0117]